MWACLKRVTAPPIFEGDETKTRLAAACNTLLWTFLLILVLYACLAVPFFVEKKGVVLLILAGLIGLSLGVRAVLAAGHVRLAGLAWLSTLWMLATALVLFGGGVRSSFSSFYLSVPALAGLLLGPRSVLPTIALCGLTLAGVAGLEVRGRLPSAYFSNPAGLAWTYVVFAMAYAVVPLIAAVKSANRALAEAHALVAERLQTGEALQRQQRQLDAIRAVGVEISQELDLVKGLRLISERLGGLVGYGRGGVCLWDDAAQVLISHTKLDEPDRGRFGLKLGHGVAGRVAQTRQGMTVNDYRRWPGAPPEVLAHTKITAMMAEPLVYRDHLVGVIHMDSEDPQVQFSEPDRDLLRLLATPAATAIANARLFQEEQERREQLEALRSVSAEVARELDLDRLLDVILRRAVQLAEAEAGAILLWDEETQTLFPRVRIEEFFGNMPKRPIGVGEGLVGRVAATRQGLIVNDYRHWAGARPPILTQTAVAASLAEPMLYRDRLIGVINLANTERRGSFEHRHGVLLRLFGDQAAIAIENARLFEAERRRSAEMESLLRTARAVMSEMDLQRTLERIVAEAADVTRCSHVKLLLLDTATGTLRVGALRGTTLPSDFRMPLGAGLSGRVAETGQPLFVTDPGRDPANVLAAQDRETGVATYLGLPIKARDRVMGVLTFNTTTPRRYGTEELAYLGAFADQAAIAVENVQLYETARQELAERAQAERALARRTQQLEGVRAVSEEIIREMRLPTLLGLIVEHARRLVDGAGGSVLLWDEARQVLVPSVHVGRPGASRASRIALGEGLSGTVARERKGRIVNDYRSSGLARPAILQHTKITATMAEPLLYQDRLVGVINIDNGDTGSTFSAEHGELLRLFATQAAIAIEHARRFEEQQHAYEDLQRAQEELVRTEKLRALGQMSAGIAHDLNNTLATVLGQTELLRLQVKLPEVQAALKVLYTAASDGAQVVRRLLEFGRQQPSRPLIPCDLGSLVDEALEMTRPRWQDEAQGQGRHIEVSRALENLPRVQGNPSEIREALTNLILNAVDAMPTGGRLAVAGCVGPGVSDAAPSGRVILTVSDTGTGMTEETRRRIFDPFFTTKGPSGTGLGLAVVYGIMERHGGKISVASTPGEGTTFTLHFQISDASPDEVGSAGVSRTKRGLCLLVIDDEELVRMTVAEMLRAVGHTVIEADSGEQGLGRLGADRMDLVITDLGMPGMTGWEVAQRVKAAWPRLPVILLTGWGQQISEVTPGYAYVDRVLEKPIRLDELQAAIAGAVAANANHEGGGSPPTQQDTET
jgi:GAF domain-containing protein/CheY-like chemotaxis protein